jgi:hypothetical protein
LSNENRKIIEEEDVVREPDEIDYTKIDLGPYNGLGLTHSNGSEFHSSGTTVTDHESGSRPTHTNGMSSTEHDMDRSYHTDDDGEADDEDEPIVFEVAAAQATSTMVSRPQVNVVKARGSLVDIAKRVPPPLPPRNPFRASVDQASGRSPTPSPTKDGFEEAELGGPTRVASVYEIMSGAAAKDGVDRQAEEENSNFVNGAHTMGTETSVVDIPEEYEQSLEQVKTAERKSFDHAKVHTPGEAEEIDNFHSIPTTPNEIDGART